MPAPGLGNCPQVLERVRDLSTKRVHDIAIGHLGDVRPVVRREFVRGGTGAVMLCGGGGHFGGSGFFVAAGGAAGLRDSDLKYSLTMSRYPAGTFSFPPNAGRSASAPTTWRRSVNSNSLKPWTTAPLSLDNSSGSLKAREPSSLRSCSISFVRSSTLRPWPCNSRRSSSAASRWLRSSRPNWRASSAEYVPPGPPCAPPAVERPPCAPRLSGDGFRPR